MDFIPVPNLSMSLSILVHGKESGAKQGIKSDWRVVTLTMVIKIWFCLDIWLFPLDIYQWAHWENLGALFENECARGRKILSGQMHPWWLHHVGSVTDSMSRKKKNNIPKVAVQRCKMSSFFKFSIRVYKMKQFCCKIVYCLPF